MVVKVGDLPAAVPLQPKKETKKSEKKGVFRKEVLQGAASVESSEKTSAAQDVSPLVELMHLQEVTDFSEKTFLETSEALLSHLETLREGLLLGSFSKSHLEAMREDLESVVLPDPLPDEAQQIFDLIQQRVYIELAKLEMSPSERIAD